MAVLIKNMEKPESCFECPCFRHDTVLADGKVVYAHGYQCNLTFDSAIDRGELDSEELVDKLLHRFCPLVEVSYWKED